MTIGMWYLSALRREVGFGSGRFSESAKLVRAWQPILRSRGVFEFATLPII